MPSVEERAEHKEWPETCERAARAGSKEIPDDGERAEQKEMPSEGERAGFAEMPICEELAGGREMPSVDKRAVVSEMPLLVERAVAVELPIRTERAGTGETPKVLVRGVRRKVTSVTERNMPTKTKITERDFLASVRSLAELLGWTCYHTWQSVHSPAGFPDLVLVKPPRVVFAELKVGNRQPTPAQREWLNLLSECPGVEAYLWRPEDWDEIQTILSGKWFS